MKKITLLALLSIFLISANTLFSQDKTKNKPVLTSEAQDILMVNPETFQDIAADNLGKEVKISGMVVHVCKHGGKKMFIMGEDPEKRIKITATEKVSVFNPELEGSTVEVIGVVEPIEEEEAIAAEEREEKEDADHANYYHRPQFSIACIKMKTIED